MSKRLQVARGAKVSETSRALFEVQAGSRPSREPKRAHVATPRDRRGRPDRLPARDFRSALENQGVSRILISSGGGHVEPAIDMAREIRDRGLDVEVFGPCFSSCANYIFPAGRKKLISGLGMVGWHGNMRHLLYLHQTNARPITGEWLEEVTHLATLEAEFFKSINVNEFVCWFAKLPPYSVRNTYFLDVDDMSRFGLKDVSVRTDYALSNLSNHNSVGVENVRFVRVDWEALRVPTLTSP